ncbi:MAG TPA: hypothetical protein VN429_11425 [Methanospirillum sp.]|uniref:phage major capsid protein n=1 Tax=Methanospirillum sp. TaxID=45200 RepID=UPI002C563B9F|nr:hypothetical protein [Methanospirillum sp.]HWQ65019.1 hypothetical protein [Methanospirillum sp.]
MMAEASLTQFFESARSQRTHGGMARYGLPDYGTPGWLQHLAESENLLQEYLAGNVSKRTLREALTRSDYPVLLGDSINRRLLAGYQTYPSTYQTWCKIDTTVKDFRTLHLKYKNTGGYLTKVDEQQEYPEAAKPAEGEYTYALGKYGEIISFSWEMLVNDDLRAFTSTPMELGEDARRTVENFATKLIADSTGPHSTFFTTERKNRLTDALTFDGLKKAWNLFPKLRSPSGQGINNRPAILAVAPSLELQAQELLQADQVWDINQTISSTKNTGNRLSTQNPFKALQLVLLDELPNVATTGTVGETSWFLLSDPNLSRGAFELGFLQGFGDNPIVIQQKSDAQTIGGGDAINGSFYNDSFNYKCVHAFGGAQKDHRFAVGSDGTA